VIGIGIGTTYAVFGLSAGAGASFCDATFVLLDFFLDADFLDPPDQLKVSFLFSFGAGAFSQG
jgi:hypothetical protein